jgi:2-polyprenyl-6-methoxyphenol hydroxylase-like FAD-dependent oxidoreductase
MTPQAGQGAAMALEDAETLAYTLERARFATDSDSARLLCRWERHRQARLAHVRAFTDRNGRLRSPERVWAMQLAKEWVMWCLFRWVVTVEGMRWLFGYVGEDVVGLLAAERKGEGKGE